MTIDMISYGEANKAQRQLRSSENKIGADAKSNFDASVTHANVKERVDSLTDKVIAHYKLTDDLAVQNAINIIKAHQKLNLTEKLIAFSGDSMVFDDLVDLSGVDTQRSSRFTHQAAANQVTGSSPEGVLITVSENVDPTRRNLIYTFDADAGVEAYVTRDEIKQDADGNDIPVTWTKLPSFEGRLISKEAHVTSSELRLKFVIPSGKRLYYYGWVIA